MRRIVRIVIVPILALLLYVAIGSFLYPLWWYPILIEHKFPFSYLLDGLAEAARIYYLAIIETLIIVLTIILFSRTPISRKLRNGISSLWNTSSFFWMSAALAMFLIIVNIIIGAGLEGRTRDEREADAKLAKSMQDLNKMSSDLSKELEEAKQLVPLSVPTNFLYLDKSTAESLYGQYEPDLVPSLVLEEMQESSEVKGRISVSDYVSTEAGKQELNRRMTEYRGVVKNPERKLKDLLQYLYNRIHFLTFRDIQPKSEALAELDKATEMLEQKHSLKVDANKLQFERAKLLSQELELTEKQLRGLHGLTLVEGTWTVSAENGTLTLERDFVENVPNSLKCEVRINSADVSTRDLAIIGKLPKKTMHLSVFGNAFAGVTDTSRTVLLKPVAIY